jgi:hypothetical protein
MTNERPKRDSMSIEEATICNMWEITATLEVLKRKGLSTADMSRRGSATRSISTF